MNKIRILLADDHAVLRAGLKMLINSQPDMDVVGEASDGATAVRQSETLEPDVVVMDIAMPGVNGLEATRQIRKRQQRTRVLALSMHANEEYLFQLLQAGGSGYVLKKAADVELLDAIRMVARGEIYLYPEVTKYLVRDYLQRLHEGDTNVALDTLTDREREVLRLVAEGYTTQEIAQQLVLSPKTVETHRAHIMDKLGLRSRSELVRYALRKGLLTPDV
ncbi:MAG: response regulator transcription factor [Chloroflexi bacterium]|nr:response regulator transcription factor [Chloroflexota bacterium]